MNLDDALKRAHDAVARVDEQKVNVPLAPAEELTHIEARAIACGLLAVAEGIRALAWKTSYQPPAR